MISTRTPFKMIRTNVNKIDSIPIVDGQFILVEEMNGDSAYIASDNRNGRQRYEDIVDLNFERERDLITPSKNKFYFVKETAKLYKYIEEVWVCLNSAMVVQVDRIMDLPAVGDENTVYFVRNKNLTYYWNSEELHYYCAGADWHDIEVVDCNFTVD